MDSQITPDLIIKTVCEALQLDRDKLLTEKAQRNKDYKEKYEDAGHIIAYLIRSKVFVPKISKQFGKELKNPSYKEITSILKRKSHKTILYWELECKIKLRDKNKDFQQKYNTVVNMLDHNVNIA